MVLLFFSRCSSSEEVKEIVPKITIQNVAKLEGDEGIQVIDFKITLDENHSKDIILKYSTDDGSAFQISDYKKLEPEFNVKTLNRDLNDLVKGNLLIAEGEKRGRKYKLAK